MGRAPVHLCPTAAGYFAELGHKPRLANPRFAHHGDDGTTAFEGCRQRLVEPGTLCLTADEDVLRAGARRRLNFVRHFE